MNPFVAIGTLKNAAAGAVVAAAATVGVLSGSLDPKPGAPGPKNEVECERDPFHNCGDDRSPVPVGPVSPRPEPAADLSGPASVEF
jgi:hypothetical protein